MSDPIPQSPPPPRSLSDCRTAGEYTTFMNASKVYFCQPDMPRLTLPLREEEKEEKDKKEEKVYETEEEYWVACVEAPYADTKMGQCPSSDWRSFEDEEEDDTPERRISALHSLPYAMAISNSNDTGPSPVRHGTSRGDVVYRGGYQDLFVPRGKNPPHSAAHNFENIRWSNNTPFSHLLPDDFIEHMNATSETRHLPPIPDDDDMPPLGYATDNDDLTWMTQRELDFVHEGRNELESTRQFMSNISIHDGMDVKHDIPIDDNDDNDNNKRTCVVCLAYEAQCMSTVECLHICMCIACSLKLKNATRACERKCPICNEAFSAEGPRRVYFS